MNWHRVGILLCGMLGVLMANGQSKPNYSRHIQPIITQHCAPCHYTGGPAPFSLTTYESVHKRASMIAHVTQTKLMPPWPADPSYRHFQNENVLSDKEKRLIQAWASNGAPQGKNAVKQVETPEIQEKGPSVISLVPSYPQPVPVNESDRFVFQLLPDTLKEDLDVQGFQFRPGNRMVVHHLELLAIAPEDWPKDLDSLFTEVEYFPSSLNEKFQGKLKYVAGWLPGNQGEFFPEGIGRKLAKGTRFVLMAHYGPNHHPTTDLSTVDIILSPQKPSRWLESLDFHGGENLPGRILEIPADTIITFHATQEVTKDLSLFSIYPHAHHLAQSMQVFAVMPLGDTLPLLRIPQWQFDWQMRYDFEEFVHLSAGSIVHFLATYDNTEENPENPFSPPKIIPNSFNANDEMMELFLWTVPFSENDRGTKIKFSENTRL